jgi:hypothetical protein
VKSQNSNLLSSSYGTDGKDANFVPNNIINFNENSATCTGNSADLFRPAGSADKPASVIAQVHAVIMLYIFKSFMSFRRVILIESMCLRRICRVDSITHCLFVFI